MGLAKGSTPLCQAGNPSFHRCNTGVTSIINVTTREASLFRMADR